MSDKKLPKIIEEVGFDFNWIESKVWALDFPVEEIPLSDLAWHFEIPFWSFLNDGYNLTPSQVVSEPEKYKVEYNRIMQADLLYPIDIMETSLSDNQQISKSLEAQSYFINKRKK